MAPDEAVGVRLEVQDFEKFVGQLTNARQQAQALNTLIVGPTVQLQGIKQYEAQINALARLANLTPKGGMGAGMQAVAADARGAAREIERAQATQRKMMDTALRRAPEDVALKQRRDQEIDFINQRLQAEKNLTSETIHQANLRKEEINRGYEQARAALAESRRQSSSTTPADTAASTRGLATLQRQVTAARSADYRDYASLRVADEKLMDQFNAAEKKALGEEATKVAELKDQWRGKGVVVDQATGRMQNYYETARKQVVKTATTSLEEEVSAAGVRVGRTYEVFESFRLEKEAFDKRVAEANAILGVSDEEKDAIAKQADRRGQIYLEEQARVQKQVGNRLRQESFEKSFMGQLASAESRTYGARILASEMQRLGMGMFLGGVGVEVFAQKQAEKYLTEFRQPLGRVQRALDLTDPQKEFLDTTLLQRAGKESMVSAVDSADAMRVWSEAINTVVDSEKDLYDATSQTGLVVQTELITNLVKLNEGTATVDQTVTDTAAIMTQFGLVEADTAKQTENLTKVVALLDTAAASGLANVNDIGASLKFFAGRAHDLGVALPEAVASIEMLAQVGLKGSQSGRGMDQLIKSLVAPTPKAQDAFANLLGEEWKGEFFDLSDAEQQFKGLANFLQEMADATEDMSVMQRQEQFAALGDANAIRTLNALILRTIEARKMGIEMGYGEVDYLKTLTQLREQGSAGLENELKVLEAVAGIDFGDLSAVDSYQKRLSELRADISTLYSQEVIRLETSFLSLGKSLSDNVVPAFRLLADAMEAIGKFVDKYPWISNLIVGGAAATAVAGAATLATSGMIRLGVNFQTIKMALTGAGGLGKVVAGGLGKTPMGLAGATERQIAAMVELGMKSGGGVITSAQQESVLMAARMSKAILKPAEVEAVKVAALALGETGILAKQAIQAAMKSAAPAVAAEAATAGGTIIAKAGVAAVVGGGLAFAIRQLLSLPVVIIGEETKIRKQAAEDYIAQQRTVAGSAIATTLRAPDLLRMPMGMLGPMTGPAAAVTGQRMGYGIMDFAELLGAQRTTFGMAVPETAPTADDFIALYDKLKDSEDGLTRFSAAVAGAEAALLRLPDIVGGMLTNFLGPDQERSVHLRNVVDVGQTVLTRLEMAADELGSGAQLTRVARAFWALAPWAQTGEYYQRRGALVGGQTYVRPEMQAQYLNANARNVEMQYFPAPSAKTKAEWAKMIAEIQGGIFDAMPTEEDIGKVVKDLTDQANEAAVAMTEAGVPAERISEYLSSANDYIATLADSTNGAYSNMVGLAVEAGKVARNLAESQALMEALARIRTPDAAKEDIYPMQLNQIQAEAVNKEYIQQAESMRAELVKTGLYTEAESFVIYNQAVEALHDATRGLVDGEAGQVQALASWVTTGTWTDTSADGTKIVAIGQEIIRTVLDRVLASLQGVLDNASAIVAGKKKFDDLQGKMRTEAQAARDRLALAGMTQEEREAAGLLDELKTAQSFLVEGSQEWIDAQTNYGKALSQVGSSAQKATMSLQDVATKWRGMIESALDVSKGLAVTDKQWNQTLGMQGGPPEDQGDSNKAKMWSALSAAIGPYVDTAWEPLRRLASAANDPQTKWAGLLPGGVSPGTPQAQAYFSFVQDRVNAFDPAFSEFFPDKKKLLEGIMGDLAGQGRKEQFITDVVAEGAAMGLDEATLRKYFEDPQAQLDKTMGLLDGSIAVSRTSTDNLKDSMDKSKTAVDDSTSATIGLTAVMEKFIPPAPPDGEKPPPPPPPDPNAAKKGDGGYEAFAKGGLVTRPTFALIGEAGPELIIPLGKSGGFTSKGFIAPTQIMLQSISPQIGQLNLNTTVNGAPSQLARNLVHTQKAAARNLGFEILRLAAREGA